MDRVLTTHTGSLVRPRALAEMMTAGPPADEHARAERDCAIAARRRTRSAGRSRSAST